MNRREVKAMNQRAIELTAAVLLTALLLGGCGGFKPPEWHAGEWAVYRLPAQQAGLRLELLPALEAHLMLQLTYDGGTSFTVIQLELERNDLELFAEEFYALIDDPEARQLGRASLVELAELVFTAADRAVIFEEPGPVRELTGAELWDDLSGRIPTAAAVNDRYTVVDFLWKPDSRRTPCLLISMEGGVLMLSEEVPISGLVHLHLGGPMEPLWLELKDYDYTGAVDALRDRPRALRAPEASE
jgi:hypothetical protein